MQAIGCVAARMCNTNNCPAGISTQAPELRKRMNVEKGAARLHNFSSASTELIQVMARACGYDAVDQFNIEDLTTWKKEMAELAGIGYAGVGL
jgi:glutamate synthase domain-containing protein 2